MKFPIKNFFSKFDQIRSKLWIWSHSLNKSLMENFVFCAVNCNLTCSITKFRFSLLKVLLITGTFKVFKFMEEVAVFSSYSSYEIP